jgi:hypothetical protein
MEVHSLKQWLKDLPYGANVNRDEYHKLNEDTEMNRKLLGTVLVQLLLQGLTVASFGLQAAESKSPPAVPPVMYEFLGEIMRLQPFMTSEKEFTAQKNADKIGKH